MPSLLLKLWREQHPKGHEQTNLNFRVHILAASPVPLFEGKGSVKGSLAIPSPPDGRYFVVKRRLWRCTNPNASFRECSF